MVRSFENLTLWMQFYLDRDGFWAKVYDRIVISGKYQEAEISIDWIYDGVKPLKRGCYAIVNGTSMTHESALVLISKLMGLFEPLNISNIEKKALEEQRKHLENDASYYNEAKKRKLERYKNS